jgi:hypothetical protein
MTSIEQGKKAPNINLQTYGKEEFSLAETTKNGSNVLLVFLRQLG